MDIIIETTELTRDFGHGRGIFQVDLQVERGICFGFLGPNGAGKTTTIRHLMGFSRQDSGTARILGMDCWEHSAALQAQIGYLPGEIAFPKAMKGSTFLSFMGRMRRGTDTDRREELIRFFELEADMPIEDMSLGMRRKLAVVTAFMHDPEILILDEPTSGLDPVMQERFIQFLLGEKERGKTIFLSSHIFHEVDACCDRIAIIRAGRIVTILDPETFRQRDDRTYRFAFQDMNGYEGFVREGFPVVSRSDMERSVTVRAESGVLRSILARAAAWGAEDFREMPFSLEDYFMKFYETEARDG